MKTKLICLAAVAALSLSATAYAADVGAEITTAQTHAGLAAKGATIDAVHMHIHHALNCLVGPGAAGFDASNANPCAKSGNGAIPDATAGQKAKLAEAVATANMGLAATDLAAAQKEAGDLATQIGAAK